MPGSAPPDGLTFGPDGKLYVTSFKQGTDTDRIVIFDLKDKGMCRDNIDLPQGSGERIYAQALLFGPNGRLFVPINTGEIRRYNLRDKSYDPRSCLPVVR